MFNIFLTTIFSKQRRYSWIKELVHERRTFLNPILMLNAQRYTIASINECFYYFCYCILSAMATLVNNLDLLHTANNV